MMSWQSSGCAGRKLTVKGQLFLNSPGLLYAVLT